MQKTMHKYDHLLLPNASKVVQDAGFFRRMFAFIFDILILDIIITAPFTKIFEGLLKRVEHNSLSSITYTSQELTAIVIIVMIVLSYFILFEYILGQTLGMMLMDTKLSGENTLNNCIIRNSFIIPAFPFILLWIIEPIAIIFWKRGVLEHISNTRTTHEKIIFLR